MIRKSVLFLLLLVVSVAYSQVPPQIINAFNIIPSSSVPIKAEANINATQFKMLEIDLKKLATQLKGVPHRNEQGVQAGEKIIELPWPDGSVHQYRVRENDTMHADLAAKYPEIKSYDGYGVGDSKEFAKLDLTPLGFHAMILTPGKPAVFIDPAFKKDTHFYKVYDKSHFISNNQMRCGVTNKTSSIVNFVNYPGFGNFTSCHLRKYRLAVAATTEYTTFFGGTVNNALAAQVVAINRINAVYEIETAVTLEIIGNNDLIIYTGADPYTSGDAEEMIDENQANIDATIGPANYDIGHVFDANAATSGLAGLGVVCTNGEKAYGVTGVAAPVGDPFYIDYVAHEIGHQFNADHTQNNACNRNPATSMEPGSGSTIMSYAGICAPNVQSNSDAYFHGVSLQEIGTFLSGPGDVCAARTVIIPAPVVAQPDNITVPAATPVSLVGSASGLLVNQFTYGWEQMDNAVSVQPPEATSPDGPNFRSFFSTLSNLRFLPNLTSLASNGPFTWEVIPTVSRIMNFRLTVRNNQAGGSCNAYQDMTVTVDAAAGPFVLLYPTSAGIQWYGGSQETIIWDVANSNLAPVNAATVDIFLSTDGGLNYPVTIALGVPNNGSANIAVPNINTDTARIMVRSSAGTFFTTSSNNFGILQTNTTGAPEFTAVLRNPMNKNNAFLYFSTLGIAQATDSFIVNGLQANSVILDQARNRLVIVGIQTPKRKDVSISVARMGVIIATSKIVTIPGIL